MSAFIAAFSALIACLRCLGRGCTELEEAFSAVCLDLAEPHYDWAGARSYIKITCSFHRGCY